VKSFILWLLQSGRFGEELQQSEIIHFCRQQFAYTMHGSSNPAIHAKLGELESERRYSLFPVIRSRLDGRNKIYFIPDVVDVMLPWWAKLGFSGTLAIIAISFLMSFLMPGTWMETISFGNNPPIVVYRWNIEPPGLVLVTALITLWLSIIIQGLHSSRTKGKG